jgi:hypothetical protein
MEAISDREACVDACQAGCSIRISEKTRGGVGVAAARDAGRDL